MPRLDDASSEERFRVFVEELVGVIGHADRAGPLRDYCTGLLLPAERKSVEPMAAITAPSRVAAQHQSLLHFVGQMPWPDETVLAKVATMVTPTMESSGPIEAWIIDDTRFARVRVRPAHRDYNLSEARPEEWLLIEWPIGEDEPNKYWLSTFPRACILTRWCSSPRCGGESSATISSSSRSLGSATTRGAAGAASTTMQRSASHPTDS